MSGSQLESLKTDVSAAEHAVEPLWRQQEIGVFRDFSGVHLGFVGGAVPFRDSHEEPVEDLGLVVGVSQSSAGYTSVYAKSMAGSGYVVEALNPDASSKKTMWRGGDKAQVSYDRGKMGRVAFEDWATANFRNPGTRFGIIRTTDPEDKVRYFALGATFIGREDNWNVTARIVEIFPTERPRLTASALKQLGAGATEKISTDDPSPIKGNLVNGLLVDGTTISKLAVAFQHATPDVHILHADYQSAKAAGNFADLAIDLMIKVATDSPELMDGTEEMMDELGYRGRLVARETGTNNRGYIHAIDDEAAARIAYLEALRGIVSGQIVNSDTAHNFTHFMHKALEILNQAFSDDRSLILEADSPLAASLMDIIATDQQETLAIYNHRRAALETTVLNPDWRDRGVVYRAAIPGQKIEIDLSAQPLLTPEQTYHGFYIEQATDSRSIDVDGYEQPAVAILEINGQHYVLVDTRQANDRKSGGQSRKTYGYAYDDQRDASEFKLLQISSPEENPRYGLAVIEQRLHLGGKFNEYIQTIRNFMERDDRGFSTDTAVTIEYDQDSGKLMIISPHTKVGVTATSDAVRIASSERTDSMKFEQRQAIRKWKEAVKSVQRETAALRERLERSLSGYLEDDSMTGDQIKDARARIEAQIARGPSRSWTYNGNRGDKWHRSQTYYVTLDEEGNVWGDFEAGRYEIGITGKPLSPGKHLMHSKPSFA